ncbi:MAG: M23 family metallopeptidase [Candidatus Eisenbacteria bacterium]
MAHAFALAGPLLLAGLLPIAPGQSDRWSMAGAWQMPVGDPYAIDRPAGDVPAFHRNRGIERSGERVTHQGADLANGRAGDTVRAAASGLVVRAEPNASNGYGGYIVLAHRLPAGQLVYSVYAHLLLGTIRVHEGEQIPACEPIARVGQTGRASTPHLHFEIRRAPHPFERWERAAVTDPVAFVLERLPATRNDTTWARPYLEWAEYAALIPRTGRGKATLTRGAWWRMLANTARCPMTRATGDAESLRDSLLIWGLLPTEETHRSPTELLDWKSLSRDLARLNDNGVRLEPAAILEEAHHEQCERLFDDAQPLREPGSLARRSGAPTMAEGCVLLVSACGPYDPVTLRRKPERKAHHPKRRAKS